MSLRQRINQHYATASTILVAWIGLLANSWVVFGLAATILLLLQILGGSIRLGSDRRPRFSRSRFRARRYA